MLLLHLLLLTITLLQLAITLLQHYVVTVLSPSNFVLLLHLLLLIITLLQLIITLISLILCINVWVWVECYGSLNLSFLPNLCTFVTSTINHGDQILSYLVENISITKKHFIASVDNNHAYDYIETFILVN